MPVVPPLAHEKAPESTQAIYERIKETVGNGQLPVGYQMMGHVEPFLQDSYMNYRKFINDGSGTLDVKQREAIVLATSSANNCVHCVRHHARHALTVGWTEAQVAEILAVTATCAMYNNYFKFKDLSGDEAFKGMSVGLRAHTFVKTSLEQPLVELINIVVSNINGCPMCTSGHVAKALELGLTHDAIDEAIKISAAMTAFNVFHRTQ
jgi:alkyl hydroperoxide reductase subunit D